jgi:hypothetical protein
VKYLAALAAALLLTGCSLDSRPDAKEVLYLQEEIKYDFEAVIAQAHSLCENGEPALGEGLNLREFYNAKVQSYNSHQAYLKDNGYGGPAEYPERIPDLTKPGYINWCDIETKVRGMSCADDL